ncbi:heme exporter protein CcmD [Limoniibacter endophyticus]|uniref:heme exporter protein CcmD n=1 Tax=Limoniibacter endophyticus TaxID=1565040 RepID=UPI001674DF6A|nr:heme exporter protein CcmD [Limoniibacter endophyticus]
MSTHALYVASAYGVALIGLGGLVLALILDGSRKKKRLAQLEAYRQLRPRS